MGAERAETVKLPQELRKMREEQIAFLESKGINPYPPEPPHRTVANVEIRQHQERYMEQDKVCVTGRIMSIRGQGKLTFIDVDDGSGSTRTNTLGKIQGMLSVDELGEQGMSAEGYEIFQKGFDYGDIVALEGKLGLSKRGELSVKAVKITMLAKAMVPFEVAKGRPALPDVETQRNQRYLHLLASPEGRERFRIRQEIVNSMRREFDNLGNLEVKTPVLDTTYGGASARPFMTHQNALDQDMCLRIANELYLKRLVVGMLCKGAGGVYEFSDDFRNEGMDKTHHPEFTQVELYTPYWDYKKMMQMTERLYKKMAKKITGSTQVKFGDGMIDFSSPWRKLTIFDGLWEVLHINPRKIPDNDLRDLAVKYLIHPEEDRDHILLSLFEEAVEPTIGLNPTFVLDYPKLTSPLTKTHRKYPDLVERFELYIGGMEVGNCYTELNDPREQRLRFEEELRRQSAGDTEAQLEDEDFILAMEYGLPPMGGIGLSIDRMAMIFTDTHHIQDVILFPHKKAAK